MPCLHMLPHVASHAHARDRGCASASFGRLPARLPRQTSVGLRKVPARAGGGDDDVPARITDTSQMSLKAQLRLVQRAKGFTGSGNSRPAPRTSFRKKKKTEEERQEDLRQRKEQSRFISEATQSLRNLYGTSGDEVPPVLLVDGYNVLGAHDPAVALRDAGDLQGGRQMIEAMLVEYSQSERVKIVLVWDAYRSENASTTVETTAQGLDVVFCRESADSYIVNRTGELLASGTPNVTVASSDKEIQDLAFGGGALRVSARELLQEMRRNASLARQGMQDAAIKAAAHSRGLGKSVQDMEVLGRLNEMRSSLPTTDERRASNVAVSSRAGGVSAKDARSEGGFGSLADALLPFASEEALEEAKAREQELTKAEIKGLSKEQRRSRYGKDGGRRGRSERRNCGQNQLEGESAPRRRPGGRGERRDGRGRGGRGGGEGGRAAGQRKRRNDRSDRRRKGTRGDKGGSRGENRKAGLGDPREFGIESDEEERQPRVGGDGPLYGVW
ncbi:unnamed protein product [Pedinophyceae sp. YPF-701]|nr:unnamed protein product [Pedinophyceae sp. YPF-701]